MNGPARQGTGPSRETLFITRRGGAEGLYVIKRDIPCFFSFFLSPPSFSFIFARTSARAVILSRDQHPKQACDRIATVFTEIEFAERAYNPMVERD